MNHGIDYYINAHDGYPNPFSGVLSSFAAAGAATAGITYMSKRERDLDFDQTPTYIEGLPPKRFRQSAENIMPALTGFRNQYSSRRGRRRGTVRRLARVQRTKRLDGSSVSEISSSHLIPLAAGSSSTSGGTSYMVIVPNLAHFYAVRSVNETVADVDSSGQQFFMVKGFRHDLELTPNWSTQTNAVAVEFEIMQCRTSRILPLGSVIAVPTATAQPTQSSIYLETLQNGKSNAATPDGFDQITKDLCFFSRVDPTEGLSATLSCNQARNIYQHPEILSRLTIMNTRRIYIPVNQTASTVIRYPGVSVSNVPIAALPTGVYDPPTTTETDAINTPNFPKGWPVTIVRVWAHFNSASIPVGNLPAADGFHMVSSFTYKVPEKYGRELDFNNAQPTEL